MKQIYNKRTTEVAIMDSKKIICCNMRSLLQGFGVSVTLWILLSVFMLSNAFAQSATISGAAFDASTGKALAGVTVGLQGTHHTTITDSNGQYTLHQAPAGDHQLVFNHFGYGSRNLSVSVEENENIQESVALDFEPVEGDEIFVDARLRGQTHSFDKQRQSINIKSVISTEQLDRFADYRVEEALARFPGVQMGPQKEINIRGAGRNMHNVTVDGQRMATTGLGDRRVDLGGISVDMLQDIEVIKVVTPDMDAEALSGVINLNTRPSFMENRGVSVRLGGGGNTEYFNHSGPNSRASLSYADSPWEGIFISFNINHHLDNRAWESLGVSYDVADFGNGPVDVIESISPALQTDGRRRVGSAFQMVYQPSENSVYHFRGMLNNDNRELIRHERELAAGGDWQSQDSTGLQGGQGYARQDVRLQNVELNQYLLEYGASHQFDFLNLDYNLGWSMGQFNQQQDLPFFQYDGLDYVINWEDRDRPAMDPYNARRLIDGSIHPEEFRFQRYDRIYDNHVDNIFSGSLDLEIPFALGSVKVGSSALFKSKDGEFDDSRYTILAIMRMNQFEHVRHGGIRVFDQDRYNIPLFVNPHGARQFYTGNRPQITRQVNVSHERSDIWNYAAQENIYAGYGMTTLEFGRLTLLAGARVEFTDFSYDGRKVSFSELGNYQGYVDTSSANDYLHLFPNAQLMFEPGDWTNIRAAYSRTIARPDFNLLAPFELAHLQDTTLFRGNPDLEPMISDNLDLQFDQYFPSVGNVSVGLFNKRLTKGFVYERQRTIDIQEGDFPAFDPLFEDDDVTVIPVHERMFQNSEESADLYGVELSWQQYLSFLPGFLGNFGLFANYTWTQSSFDADNRDDEVRLPYQSPHVANAALDYNQGRFSTQVSWHWTAEAVSNLQNGQNMAPSIDPAEPVYVDHYEDGWSDVSVSFRFRISDHFRFWANATNLLETEYKYYAHSRDLYPLATDFRGGRTFLLGIRYDL